MGMSASQARFLQLTARKSNVEYQAQRINFERLQLADKSAAASAAYNEKLSNRKMVYTFNTGKGTQDVDVTYSNYKNYMNQQLDGLETSANKMFLVSSSGNKIIVGSEEDMKKIIDSNKKTVSGSEEEINKAKELYDKTEDITTLDPDTIALAKIDITESSGDYHSTEVSKFDVSDFMIVDDLDNQDAFQRAIEEGIYYFATYDEKAEGGPKFKTEAWDSLQAGSIKEEYDKSDDARAQAEYDKAQSQIQSKDKKLELQLDKLNTEREALETEMESVQKVIDDNVESSFKVFS